jgi:hypothetical protein
VIIHDEHLLEKFRRTLRCEWCGRRGYVNPHHLWARGAGGGSRLDIRINLMAMCHVCHREVHDGKIKRQDLLATVAIREGLHQDDISREINRLKRARR